MKNNLVVQQHFGNLRSTKILERRTFFDNYLTSEVKKRKIFLRHLYLVWSYWIKYVALNGLENPSWRPDCKCRHKPKKLFTDPSKLSKKLLKFSHLQNITRPVKDSGGRFVLVLHSHRKVRKLHRKQKWQLKRVSAKCKQVCTKHQESKF